MDGNYRNDYLFIQAPVTPRFQLKVSLATQCNIENDRSSKTVLVFYRYCIDTIRAPMPNLNVAIY